MNEPRPDIGVRAFQQLIERTFGAKDRERGMAGTFMWFTEEVGELARALKKKDPDRQNVREEFADVLAWLSTLASIAGIDLADATAKYRNGCARCHGIPCTCAETTPFRAAQP